MSEANLAQVLSLQSVSDSTVEVGEHKSSLMAFKHKYFEALMSGKPHCGQILGLKPTCKTLSFKFLNVLI